MHTAAVFLEYEPAGHGIAFTVPMGQNVPALQAVRVCRFDDGHL